MRKSIKSNIAVGRCRIDTRGCQALTGETLGESIDDTGITTRRVVQSSADRARAETFSRTVIGGKAVTNNMPVGP